MTEMQFEALALPVLWMEQVYKLVSSSYVFVCLNVLTQIIYINRKQNRSRNGPLGDPFTLDMLRKSDF